MLGDQAERLFESDRGCEGGAAGEEGAMGGAGGVGELGGWQGGVELGGSKSEGYVWDELGETLRSLAWRGRTGFVQEVIYTLYVYICMYI